MIDRKIEVSKQKGLLDSIVRELRSIKFNLAEDNCEKTYSKMLDLMPYVNEMERLCNNIYTEENPESKEGDEFI